MRREVRATATGWRTSTTRTCAAPRGGGAAGARVERALEIPGPDAPEHLVMAGGCVSLRQAS